MTERSINLRDWEAAAVRDGHKTQKRFVIKPQPPEHIHGILKHYPNQSGSPYGVPGDRLYRKPKWSSDIWLEVVSVRVQRLQDITDAEAMAEGFTDSEALVGQISEPYRSVFVSYWQMTHRKPEYDWYANPYVWTVEWRLIDV